MNHKISQDALTGLIQKLLSSKDPHANKDLLVAIADIHPQPLDILKKLYQAHPNSPDVTGRLLNAMVDSGNIQEALKL